ncbi:MAG: VCBS repeat-containing protein [Acidobacteria bacterium]|nr:VCBS repeat-containing protein [Acidobacteriota bacterium]
MAQYLIEGNRLSRLKILLSIAVISVFLVAGGGIVRAQAINEGFENVAGLTDWFAINHSSPLGASVWSQCSGTAIPPAQAGTTNSCILVNFNSTTGAGTISNWLIAPSRTFNNGDTISFYTKTPSTTFPDRMQVRLSTNGTSTNVGTTATDVGDFTTLLLDINPTYGTSYPLVWTQFTITISGLSGPTAGRVAFRYFVEDGGPDGANSNIIGIDSFVYTPAAVVAHPQHVVDFDGNGKTDFAVVRNTGGGPSGQETWFINLNGTSTTYASAWGIASDFFVPADFDGDQKTDIAVWRPIASGQPSGNAFFYILQSQTNTLRTEDFGQNGDNPKVVGDYNGDGKADVAVYRPGANSGDPSTWFYRTTAGGAVTYVPWGQNGDFPAPGDYDGDGKNDFVVQRNNGGGQARFWMNQTTAGFNSIVFGTPTDNIVPGDYDGDGKTDLAVVRGSAGAFNWYVRPSSTGAISGTPYAVFGASATDFFAQGDYDGDGKTDVAIWRPSASAGASAFWALGSTAGTFAVPFGQNGDYPVANYNHF